MINICDFIRSNSNNAVQANFGRGEQVFVDYHCPITADQTRVWSHKNLLMYIVEGTKGYETVNGFHIAQKHQILFIRKGGYTLHQQFEKPYHALVFMFDDDVVKALVDEYPDLLKLINHSESEFMNQSGVIELKSESIHSTINLFK